MRNDYVVYIHKNILNGKVYVGQTCNLSERWRNNGKNYFNSIKFYNAIRYWALKIGKAHSVLSYRLKVHGIDNLRKYIEQRIKLV